MCPGNKIENEAQESYINNNKYISVYIYIYTKYIYIYIYICRERENIYIYIVIAILELNDDVASPDRKDNEAEVLIRERPQRPRTYR